MANDNGELTALPSLNDPGKYLVGKRLGVGGMAEVFRGFLRGADGFRRPVVIKKILPRFAGDPRFIRLFVEEARLASRLSHANIVQVIDFGRTPTEHFIILELVDGPNLGELLKALRQTRRTLQVPLAVFIAGEVLKALEHAHRATDNRGQLLGCVHRDVSPGNVLLSRDGQVKLTDFGVAKARGRISLTEPGQVKGKLDYFAPEQARGEEVDARVDIFAAGLVLYEMLTGRRPFAGTTPIESVEKLLNAPLVPASVHNEEVPPEIDAVVARALAREPAARFPDAESFLEALYHAMLPHGPVARAWDLSACLDAVFGPPEPARLVEVEELPRRSTSRPLPQVEEPTAPELVAEPTLPLNGPAVAVLAGMPSGPPPTALPVNDPRTMELGRVARPANHPPVARTDTRPRPAVRVTGETTWSLGSSTPAPAEPAWATGEAATTPGLPLAARRASWTLVVGAMALAALGAAAWYFRPF